MDHSRKSPGDSGPQAQQYYIDRVQKSGNGLSHKLTSQLSRIRWSSLGLLSSPEPERTRKQSSYKTPRTSNTLPSHLTIGEPILCSASASMDGQPDVSLATDLFHTSHSPPKPPPASNISESIEHKESSARSLSSSLMSVSSTEAQPSDIAASPALLSTLNLDTVSIQNKGARHSYPTLEDLPSRFDEFRSKAYDDAPSAPLVEQENDCANDMIAVHLRDLQSHTGDTTASEVEEPDHEALFDSPESDESQMLIRSGSSTRSTAGTCMSQEFYFDDPPRQKPRQTSQPSRVISTWRPEQLVTRATSSPLSLNMGPKFTDSACPSTANDAEPYSLYPVPKESKTTSQASLGVEVPLPPTKATQSPRTALDSSLEDLLGSLDSSVGIHPNQTLISSALASEPMHNSELDISKIYREAINRLNEVRHLEVQMLVDRIKKLEAREQQYCDMEESPLELFNKTRGLPRLLPINTSTD